MNLFKIIKNAIIKFFKMYRDLLEYKGVKLEARNGDPDAMYYLGIIYEKGNVAVDQDLIRAYYIFLNLANQGHNPAKQKIELLNVTLPAHVLEHIKQNIGL